MTMAWKSLLKPDQSVLTAIATAGVVYAIYQTSMPSLCDVHNTNPHNQAIDSGRKKAMVLSAGIVSGAFLLTKDINVFIAGGAVFLGLEWSYRHANASHPETGKMVPYSGGSPGHGYSSDSTGDGGYEDDGDGNVW
jgi:hypothetical protein